MPTYVLGKRRGLRLDLHPGLWVSLGCHAHVWPLSEAHLDLQLGWVLLTFERHYA